MYHSETQYLVWYLYAENVTKYAYVSSIYTEGINVSPSKIIFPSAWAYTGLLISYFTAETFWKCVDSYRHYQNAGSYLV